MKSAVLVFPGSNCDRDLAVAIEQVTGRAPAMVWHRESELPQGTDFVAIPGGFSYGDYLRSGAMAARSPIMQAVAEAAGKGVPVLGVCNGFQVLTEAGLLPGALMRNAGTSFAGRSASGSKIASRSSPRAITPARKSAFRSPTTTGISRPMPRRWTGWSGEGRVAFRYTGEVNGSARSIAGILNTQGNVLGMMPHPERVVEAAHGGTDGRRLFEGLLEAVA